MNEELGEELMPIFEVEGELGNSEDEFMIEKIIDEPVPMQKNSIDSTLKSISSERNYGKIIIAED